MKKPKGRIIYLTYDEIEAIRAARAEVIANYEGADDEEYIAFWDKNLPLINKVERKFYGTHRKNKH